MKTANILITKGGVLKLADFGLARAFSFRYDIFYSLLFPVFSLYLVCQVTIFEYLLLLTLDLLVSKFQATMHLLDDDILNTAN